MKMHKDYMVVVKTKPFIMKRGQSSNLFDYEIIREFDDEQEAEEFIHYLNNLSIYGEDNYGTKI